MSKQTDKGYANWPRAAIGLGVVATGLGCWAAYEFGLKLEGGQVSYLAIAAPVVAASAALIPPLAENCWRSGQYLKCVLWWLVLIPAAATVFYASAERVHLSKAGAVAERQATRNVAERAQADLAEAKAKFELAQADWNKVKARTNQGPKWQNVKATYEAADVAVEKAKAALVVAEGHATQESPHQAPVWLLPAALDLIAFMAIWTGLTGPKPRPQTPKPVPVKKRVTKKPKGKTPSSRSKAGKIEAARKLAERGEHIRAASQR